MFRIFERCLTHITLFDFVILVTRAATSALLSFEGIILNLFV